MTEKRKILIGGAWPYANGPLHLGHVSSLIGGDVLARFHRLNGDDVCFISGSDCFGTPIAVEAMSKNISPEELSDTYHKEFVDVFNRLSFSFDNYTKTNTEEHKKVVQEVFLHLKDKGHIYTKTEKHLYSPKLDRFLPDRFVVGECPKCGFKDARGDQCDECGGIYEASELKNPRANDKVFDVSDKLELKDTEHLYFKLSDFENDLKKWFEENKTDWRINTQKVTEGFFIKGLHDRAITRDTDWGVPIPLPNFEDKRIYVWFDAVLGYLSASKKEFWEGSLKHYYVHGKDNIPFHTIIFPAILLGIEKHLPNTILSSEYLSLEGSQFSKSRDNAIWVKDFLDKYDSETLRYHLISQGPETGDTDFRVDDFIEKVNGELIGTFGNLVNRIFSLVEKDFPQGVAGGEDLVDSKVYKEIGDIIEKGEFRKAIREVFKIADECNKFAQIKEPWKKGKDGEEDLAALIRGIANISVLISPFLPKSAEKIQKCLGISLNKWELCDKKDFKVRGNEVLYDRVDL